MYPIAGGTARFPHLAYGSVAGHLVRLLLLAAGGHRRAGRVLRGDDVRVVLLARPDQRGKGHITTTGFLATIVLMAIFTAINFLGGAAVRPGQQHHHLVEGRDPGPDHHHPVHPSSTAATSAPAAAGSCRTASRRCSPRIPSAGIVFAYLGFEQADQLAGRDQGPGAQPAARDHHRGPARHGDLHPAAGRLHRRDAVRPADPRVPGHPVDQPGHPLRPFAAVAALAGLGFWATILRIDAFVSPFGTGLIYQTSTSRVGYGLARNRYFPQIFAGGQQQRRAVVRPDHGVRVRPVLPAAVPELAVAGRPGHRRERAHVRGRAAVAGRFPQEASRRGTGPTGCRSPRSCRRSPSSSANMLIYWSGFVVVWKLGACLVIGYILIGISMVVRPAAAAAAVEVGAVAAGLPDRHGHHLLAGPVPAQGRRAARRRSTPSTSRSGGTS